MAVSLRGDPSNRSWIVHSLNPPSPLNTSPSPLIGMCSRLRIFVTQWPFWDLCFPFFLLNQRSSAAEVFNWLQQLSYSTIKQSHLNSCATVPKNILAQLNSFWLSSCVFNNINITQHMITLVNVLYILNPFLSLGCLSVCVWLCVSGRWGTGKTDPFIFICLYKPHLFLQPDVNWQTSLSGPLDSPSSLHQHPCAPPTTPLHNTLLSTRRSGTHLTTAATPPPPPSALQKMDVSLKQRLIVDIRVMAPFITANIIQTNGIEQGGGTPEPMGGFWGVGAAWRKFNRL